MLAELKVEPSWCFCHRSTEINFVGGDKPVAKCKPLDDEVVVAYLDSLTELVKAVGIADSLGLSLEDIEI